MVLALFSSHEMIHIRGGSDESLVGGRM